MNHDSFSACLTDADLRLIVERSSYPHERRSAPYRTGSPARENRKQVDARLADWKEITADNDKDAFAVRLDLLGFSDPGEVRRCIDDVKLRNDAGFPNWVCLLNVLLQKASDFPGEHILNPYDHGYAFLEKDDPIAFEEAFIPAVMAARELLRQRIGKLLVPINTGSMATFERMLVQRFSELCGRTLEVEFGTFSAMLQVRGRRLPNVSGRGKYLGFVLELFSCGFREIFMEYPVLARAVAVQINFWIDMVEEFLVRFHKDRNVIAEFFGVPDVGRIESVFPEASDPHCQGRTVVQVLFSSDLRLLYKPKPVGVDRAFLAFVSWLNREFSSKWDLMVFKVLDRGEYGWVEFVEPGAMEEKEAAERYFKRAGMLLALFYLFGSVDFHFENLIAGGEHPVPIDLETVIQHRIRQSAAASGLSDAAERMLVCSVMRTDFLPKAHMYMGQYWDMAGLGAVRKETETIRLLRWKEVNTDHIRYHYVDLPSGIYQQGPHMNGNYLSAEDYVDQVVCGFSRACRFFMENRERIIDSNYFTDIFPNPIRHIFADTGTYCTIRNRAFQPKYLKDGADQFIQLDVVSRPYLSVPAKQAAAEAAMEEVLALRDMDIPKFLAEGDGYNLWLSPGRKLEECFEASPLEEVREKIRSLDEQVLSAQIKLIRAALSARRINEAYAKASMIPRAFIEETGVLPWTPEEIVRRSEVVARQILDQAVFSPDGEPSWVILKAVGPKELFAVDRIDFNLYEGRCGIALFFAALDGRLHGSDFKRAALATVAIVRRWIEHASPRHVPWLGLGGYAGIGSLIYTLVRMGQLLGDESLCRSAGEAARLIRTRHIDHDRHFDIFGGVAGLIMGLLAVYDQNPKDRLFLDLAIYGGKHLLNNRSKTFNGKLAWKSESGGHLAGFSHGAAGIAHTLACLYRRSGEKAFLEAAREAVEFETGLFNPEFRAWPDLRYNDGEKDTQIPRAAGSWCNGAPGIGLSRCAALDFFDSAAIRQQMEAAMEITDTGPCEMRDHLCCGNIGRSEALLTAAELTDREDWAISATGLTRKTSFLADVSGGFNVSFGDVLYSPGLFQGMAGIGFHLLRLAGARDLPRVLLLT